MDKTKYEEDAHKRTAALQNLLQKLQPLSEEKKPSSFCCDFFQFARRFVPISFPELCYPCPATLCFAIVCSTGQG